MHPTLRSILNLDNNLPRNCYVLLVRLLLSIVGPVSLGFYITAISVYNSNSAIHTPTTSHVPGYTSLAILALCLNELYCGHNFCLTLKHRRNNTTTNPSRTGYGIVIDLVIWILVILSLALNEHMAYPWASGALKTSPPCDIRDRTTGDVVWYCTNDWATLKQQHHIADMVLIGVLSLQNCLLMHVGLGIYYARRGNCSRLQQHNHKDSDVALDPSTKTYGTEEVEMKGLGTRV